LAISLLPFFNVHNVNTFGLSHPSLRAECEKIKARGSLNEISSSFFSRISSIPLSISSCDFVFTALSPLSEFQSSTSTSFFFLSSAK